MQESAVLVEKVLPYLRQLGFGAIVPNQSFGVGSRRVRADIVAYGDSEKPVAIAELKLKLDAPPFDNYHPAVQQAYKIALVAEAPNFLVTDGEQFHWFRVDWENGRAEPTEPPVQAITDQKRLRPFRDEAEAAQVLWGMIGQAQEQTAHPGYTTFLIALLKVKWFDELRIRSGESSQFYARPGEALSTITHRIKELLAGQPIEWGQTSDERLALAVELLQPFSLLETPSPVLISVLNGLTQRSFRRDAGEFFTPRPVAEFVIELLSPQHTERIVDPTCGSGGFLLAVLNHWRRRGKSTPLSIENLIGIDINPQVAQIAELNLMLASKGRANIYAADALDQSALDRLGIRSGTFDVVVSNPPLGGRLPETQARQFQLGQLRTRSEALFVEQALALLKDGGRVAIIVGNGILFQGGSSEQVRKWIMDNARLDAVIQLPAGAGIPGTSISTSLLILTKGVPQRESVFMARVTGFDSDERERAVEAGDLRAIVSDFRRFTTGGRDFEKGWTVANTQALLRRMDVGGNDRLFQILRAQYGAPSYELQTLEQVADVRKGYDEPYAEVGAISIITARDISTGQIKIERPRFAATSAVRLLLQDGDLIVSEFGSLSPPVLIRETNLPATIGRSVFLIRLTTDFLSSEFLQFVFTTDLIREQIEQLKSGIIARISLPDMRRLLIPIPDKKTQNEILKTLAEIRTLREKAAELEETLAVRLVRP